jgi:hypothetical protein
MSSKASTPSYWQILSNYPSIMVHYLGHDNSAMTFRLFCRAENKEDQKLIVTCISM